MNKFRIRASHTVYLTYVVEADTFEQARDKLCDRDIFTAHTRRRNGYGDDTFGPDVEYIEGVEVDYEAEIECDGDPSPTGSLRTIKQWEWEEEEEEERESV